MKTLALVILILTSSQLFVRPALAQATAGYDEKGRAYSCPQASEEQDENELAEKLDRMLKTQKTCAGISRMFENCRGHLTVYPIIDLSQGRVVPVCERAIAQDKQIQIVYKRKSKACNTTGESRSEVASSNQCQRELAIHLGEVAELK